MYTFLYSNKREKAQTKVCHEAGGSVERPLLVSQPQPGVIHSLGVWGPKRSALTRRRQLGEGRAQGLPIVFPILTALCRGIWWHGPFPCATRDIAGGGGRPGMGASHQFLQDTSILPGSLFTPSPSREQALPRIRACGCSCHAGGNRHQAKSTVQETIILLCDPRQGCHLYSHGNSGQFHVCM